MSAASIPCLPDDHISSRADEVGRSVGRVRTSTAERNRGVSRRPSPHSLSRFICALSITCAVLACSASVQAQRSPASAARVDALRGQIRSATDQEASAAQLGALWLELANEYQSQLELLQAEDAFTRSLPLLRFPATQSAYADALDGLGSLYFATARPTEAENCFRKALGVYQAIGDRPHTARLHVSLALLLVSEHRFRDGEEESSEGLNEFQSQPQPDPSEFVPALLTHSYALCNQGRCNAALDDTKRAMTLAQGSFATDSLEIAGVWLAWGFDQWKSGSPDEADRSMREALTIVRSRTDLPRPLLAGSLLGILRQYDVFLKATHRKSEARQIDSEIRRLQSEQNSSCKDCTVNAAALSPEPRRP
jgi:tetratricopeptide (TPR) repeat protein